MHEPSCDWGEHGLPCTCGALEARVATLEALLSETDDWLKIAQTYFKTVFYKDKLAALLERIRKETGSDGA